MRIALVLAVAIVATANCQPPPPPASPPWPGNVSIDPMAVQHAASDNGVTQALSMSFWFYGKPNHSTYGAHLVVCADPDVEVPIDEWDWKWCGWQWKTSGSPDAQGYGAIGWLLTGYTTKADANGLRLPPATAGWYFMARITGPGCPEDGYYSMMYWRDAP